MWIDILRREVEAKGAKAVARELDVARSTVSLVLAGKYPASTDKIEARIILIYGSNGRVQCPALGEIEPARCAETRQRAKLIGLRVGNPDTLRLHSACMQCQVRR